MTKLNKKPVTIQYPFNDSDTSYRCHCGKLLRRSSMHDGRVYLVSEVDHNEIINIKRHRCGKKKEKKKIQ